MDCIFTAGFSIFFTESFNYSNTNWTSERVSHLLAWGQSTRSNAAHRVSAGSTLAGWVDRFVPPGTSRPSPSLWKGSPGQATRHTNSWLLRTAPRKIYGILSSFDNLSLEGILDKKKSEKNLKPWAVLTRRGLGERGLKGTAVTVRNISFICTFKVNLLPIASDAKVEAFFHQLKTQLRQSPVAVPNWRRGL